MPPFDALRSAVRSQLRRPLESALLILAIALGTGVVVPLFERVVVQARQDALRSQGPELREITMQLKKNDYSGLYAGGQSLPLLEIGRVGAPEVALKQTDLERVKGSVPGIQWGYRLSYNQVSEAGNKTLGTGFEVHQVTPEFIAAYGLKLLKGAWPSALEFQQKANLLMLTEDAAKKRFGSSNPIGQVMSLSNAFGGSGAARYTVSAVFAPSSGNSFQSEANPSGIVGLAPYGSGSGAFFTDSSVTLLFMAAPGDLNATQANLRDFVAREFGSGVSVRSRLEEQRSYAGTQRAVTWVLLLFASGGLLLAALNITSLVLARVSATRHQTGIQAALGASSRQIFSQSLLESALVGLWGGFLGVGVSLLVGLTLSSTLTGGVGSAPSGAVLSAFLVWTLPLGVLTSVLFGLFPAWEASRIRPAEALRI